jgi:beta-mannanase
VIFIFVSAVNIVVPFKGLATSFSVPPSQRTVLIGAYDPADMLKSEAGIGINHVFVDWNSPPQYLHALLERAAGRDQIALVSLEPFPRSQHVEASVYASAVLKGQYDHAVLAQCAQLDRSLRPVWLRWGHEMDFNRGRYAWAGLEPKTYIAMFRHVATLCRREASAVRIVWSPGGDATLRSYYPGDSYVDIVGLTLFGLQPFDQAIFGRNRGFAEAFEEKYSLVKGFAKPVIIAEFGICGTARYRVAWLTDALKHSSRKFTHLSAIVYFNDREPYRWPEAGMSSRKASDCDMEYPDWRLKR